MEGNDTQHDTTVHGSARTTLQKAMHSGAMRVPPRPMAMLRRPMKAYGYPRQCIVVWLCHTSGMVAKAMTTPDSTTTSTRGSVSLYPAMAFGSAMAVP